MLSSPVAPVTADPALADAPPDRAALASWRTLALPVLAFLLGMAVTLLLWSNARQQEQNASRARFAYRTDRILSELRHLLRTEEVLLESVGAVLSTAGSVNHAQWRAYFQALDGSAAPPGRLWLGYAPRVREGERASHEAETRAEGVAGYAVRSSQRRGQYFPVAYLRSFTSQDRRAIGFDLQDDPAVREALARASGAEGAVLTGPLTIPGAPDGQSAWALVLPIYAGGRMPASVAERQAAVAGYVIEAIDTMELTGAALGKDSTIIGLDVRDGGARVFLCTELARQLGLGFRPTLTRDVAFDFGSRRWDVRLVALPRFFNTAASDQSAMVLSGGVLISALLAGLLGVLGNLRLQAMALAEQRTRALRTVLQQHERSETQLRAIVDHALDAIITIDAQGLVQSFNPAAERIFGWQADEVVGRNVNKLMPSPDQERHDDYIRAYLAGGRPQVIGIGRLVTGCRKDGSLVPLELGVSEMTVGGRRLFCGIVRDVAERQEAEEKLRHSEGRLRSYIEMALDGVMVVDREGRYVEVNPAAAQMMGYTEQELLQMSIAELVWPDPEARSAGIAHFGRVLQGGRSVGEVSLRRKDGKRIVADVHAVDIGEGRYLGIIRDVTEQRMAAEALERDRSLLEQRVAERTEVLTRTNTALHEEIEERRRIERELVAAREQALQAAEVKASFLANMSHEIRTPMNAVIGMTALLQETSLNAEQCGYVETIRTSGDALLATINDILDFSKIESGMLQLEQRPFELGACVEESFDMLAPRAAEKGIDLLYELMDSVPHWIVGDANRLRQVLVNLLSNAVKFTDRGEVCITVSVQRREADNLQLRFSVRDTGIGISLAQREHLFKSFSQADSSTTRKYGGTGLGLAICARLVRLMGGEFRVESEPGKGSVFSFTIQASVAANAPTARYRSGHSPELAGRRVLLVDDNATNLQILQTQCTRWGMEVACATRGAHALALLEAEGPFDLAVLDMHMPAMDGAQLARAIAAQCGPRAPRLILLSSSTPRPERAGMELFDARLSKPVKHSQLFQTMDQVLHAGAAAAVQPVARRIDPGLARRRPARILVVEDSVINQKLTQGMLEKFGYRSEVAADGMQALTMAARQSYDLVFMDLQMPVMDGLEATRRMRSTLPPSRLPRIVAMTANALPADRERCLAAGMDDYIAKPILPADVQALIERWAPQPGSRPADDEPIDTTLLNESVIQELAGLDAPGSPSMLSGLVGDFIAETPASVSAIKQHLQCGDTAQLAQRAHKLGGTSASLGASGVAEICRQVELHAKAGDLQQLPALVDQLELRFARTRAALQKYL